MALAPLSFSRTPRPRSVIADAFASAIATAASSLIREPFEKRAELRASNEARIRSEREFGQQKQYLTQQLRETGIQRQNESTTPLTGELMQQLTGIGVTPGTVAIKSIEDPSKQLISLPLAQAASQGSQAAPLQRLEGINRLYKAVGGNLTNLAPGTTNYQADLAEKSGDEAEAAKRLEIQQQEADEVKQSRLAAKGAAQDAKYAALFPALEPSDWEKFGPLTLEGEGNISVEDIQLLKGGQRAEILARANPELQKYADRSKVLNDAIRTGKLHPIALTAKAVDEYLTDISKPNGGPELQNAGVQLDNLGMFYDSRQKRINTNSQADAAAGLRSNPGLMEAWAIARWARGMNDVVESSRVYGGVRPSESAKQYLQVIFARKNVPDWKWAENDIPAPANIPFDKLPSQLQGKNQQYIPGTVSSRVSGQPTQAIPSLGNERPNDAAYTQLRSGFVTRLQADSTKFQPLMNTIDAAHANPEAAYAFWKGLGVSDSTLAKLRTGNSKKDSLEVRSLHRRMQQALLDARETVRSAP